MKSSIGNIDVDNLTPPCICECGNVDKSNNYMEVTSDSCKHRKRFLTNTDKRRKIISEIIYMFKLMKGVKACVLWE